MAIEIIPRPGSADRTHPRHALSQLRRHAAPRDRLRLSGLLRAARGRLRLRRRRRDADPRVDRRPRPRDLALRRAPPGRRTAGAWPGGRLDAAARRRPAGAAPRARSAVDQGRHAQPVAVVQGSSGRRCRGAGGRLRCRGAGLRVDRQPGRRDGRGRGRDRAAGLRLHPGRPRAGQGRPCAGLRRDGRPGRGDLRRRQPAVPRGRRRDGLGLRQHQPPPVLRRGLEDARLRDRRIARLAVARRDRRAGRLRRHVHARRARLRGAGRAGSHRPAADPLTWAARRPAAHRSRPPGRPAPT